MSHQKQFKKEKRASQSFCSIPIFGFLCQPSKLEPELTPQQKRKQKTVPSTEVLTDLFNEMKHSQQETIPKLAHIDKALSTKLFDEKLTEKEKIKLESDFEEGIKKMRQFKKILTQISSNFNKKPFDFDSIGNEGVFDNFSMSNHPRAFPNVATNITVINQPFKKEKQISKHDILDEKRARRMSDPYFRQTQKKQLEKAVKENSKKWKKDEDDESNGSDLSELEAANIINENIGEQDDKITPLNSPKKKTIGDDDEYDDNEASEIEDFEENSEAFSPSENRKRHGSLLRTASSNDWTIKEMKAEEKSLTRQLHALHQELDDR